jgi:hypothetical protein
VAGYISEKREAALALAGRVLPPADLECLGLLDAKLGSPPAPDAGAWLPEEGRPLLPPDSRGLSTPVHRTATGAAGVGGGTKPVLTVVGPGAGLGGGGGGALGMLSAAVQQQQQFLTEQQVQHAQQQQHAQQGQVHAPQEAGAQLGHLLDPSPPRPEVPLLLFDGLPSEALAGTQQQQGAVLRRTVSPRCVWDRQGARGASPVRGFSEPPRQYLLPQQAGGTGGIMRVYQRVRQAFQ